MSTILDALNRAERERRMGQVPEIEHALFDHSGPVAAPAKRRKSRWMLAAGAGSVVLAGALIFALRAPLDPTAGPSVKDAPTAPAVAAPQAEPVSAPTPAAPVAVATPSEPAPRPALAAAAPSAASKSPAAANRSAHSAANLPPATTRTQPAAHEQHARATPPAARTQPPAVKPAQENSPARAAVASSAAAATLPWYSDLPAATRRELPSITLGGYIFSAQAAERSILINGKLLREGDQLSPGLRLEQMRADGVVFAYKDLRFRMAY